MKVLDVLPVYEGMFRIDLTSFFDHSCILFRCFRDPCAVGEWV